METIVDAPYLGLNWKRLERWEGNGLAKSRLRVFYISPTGRKHRCKAELSKGLPGKNLDNFVWARGTFEISHFGTSGSSSSSAAVHTSHNQSHWKVAERPLNVTTANRFSADKGVDVSCSRMFAVHLQHHLFRHSFISAPKW